MIKQYSAQRLAIVTLTVIAFVTALGGTRHVRAQVQSTIQVEAGQTLEIGTDTVSQKPEFSWILTKNRTFQHAQRSRFFQTRLAEPGTYVLDVSVKDTVTNASEYRAFTIIVTEPTGSIPDAAGDANMPLAAILRTEPAAVGNTAYVQPEGGVLEINPRDSHGDIAQYTIDLDTSLDADTDGDPANDHDTRDTLLETSGTSLYYFMIPKNSERSIRLSVTDLSGTAAETAELRILFAPSPVPSSMSMSMDLSSPIRVQHNGATVQFSASLEESVAAGSPLLYEWDFGDRARSLLDAPAHTYATSGNFTVGLRVRDITSANVVYEGATVITIDAVSASSSASSVSSSTPSTSDGETGFSVAALLQVGFIILILIAFAVGLYFLAVWIKQRTTHSLQKTLEKMEETIVKNDPTTDTKAAPMKLKKDIAKPAEQSPGAAAVIEREKAKRDFATEQRTNETPTARSGPVPSWLATSTTVPPPAPLARTPKPPAAEQALVPAWLQQTPVPTPAATPPTPPKPTPPPAPVSVPKPTPPPEPKPAPAMHAPAPAPKLPVAPPESPKTDAKPVAPPMAPPPPPAAPAPLAALNIAEHPKPEPNPEVIPAPTPKLAPVSQPILPAEPVVKDIPKQSDDDDRTIAIIQADSLTK